MRLFLVLAAVAVPLASSPARTPASNQSGSNVAVAPEPMAARADCRRPDVHPASGDQKPDPKRLGELPAGDLYLTVFREVDNCPEPVIVGRNFGLGLNTPAPAPEPDPMPKPRIWR